MTKKSPKTSKSKTKSSKKNKAEVKIKSEIQTAVEPELKTEVPAAADQDLKLDFNSEPDSNLDNNNTSTNILDRFPNIGKRIKSSFAKTALKMKIDQEDLLKLCVQAAIKNKIKFEKKTVYVTK